MFLRYRSVSNSAHVSWLVSSRSRPHSGASVSSPAAAPTPRIDRDRGRPYRAGRRPAASSPPPVLQRPSAPADPPKVHHLRCCARCKAGCRGTDRRRDGVPDARGGRGGRQRRAARDQPREPVLPVSDWQPLPLSCRQPEHAARHSTTSTRSAPCSSPSATSTPATDSRAREDQLIDELQHCPAGLAPGFFIRAQGRPHRKHREQYVLR